MFGPRWVSFVFFKSLRNKAPLCGAAHVQVFKLVNERPPPPPPPPNSPPHRFERLFYLFFTARSHYCRCKAHRHNARPLSVIRTQTHKCRRRACPLHLPSILSAVYIKAVSNCTLSLIGSAVQCAAAVHSDKSFFSEPPPPPPGRMSVMSEGHRRKGAKVNCPLAAVQKMS